MGANVSPRKERLFSVNKPLSEINSDMSETFPTCLLVVCRKTLVSDSNSNGAKATKSIPDRLATLAHRIALYLVSIAQGITR
jgi:hypothetical protein